MVGAVALARRAPSGAPVAHTSTGRRAGLVLALAAILAPLGIGTAFADIPAPVIQPIGTVNRGESVTVDVSCADPTALGLEWHTSDAPDTWSTAQPTGRDDANALFEIPVAFQNGGWFQARCLYEDDPSGWSIAYVAVQGATTASVLQATAPTQQGGAITGSVTVTSGAGTPTGYVEVYLNGVLRDAVQVRDGVATISSTYWDQPQVEVSAIYRSNTWAFQDSTSNTVTVDLPQQQVKAQPTVTLQVPANAYANVAFPATATVTGTPGGPTPTGEVEFRYSEGAVLGRVPLVNGVATANLTVTHTGIADVYAVYFGDEHYTDRSSSYQDVSLTAAPAPVVTAPVVTVDAPKTGTTTAGITATVTVAAPAAGLPVPGGGVQLIVYRPGHYPDSVSAGVLTDGTVTLTTDLLPVGEYRLLAHYSGGGDWPYAQTDSVEQSLVISAPATTPVDPTPTTPTTPVTPKPTTPVVTVPESTPAPIVTPVLTPANPVVSTDRSLARPGARVTLRAEGFVPGETVRFVLHSDPVFLGTAVAGADGIAVLVVDLPDGVPAGQHHVVATGVDSGRVAEVPILVADPRAELATTGTDPAALTGLVAALLATGAGFLLVARLRRRQAA
jgi:hypothetical protein